MPKNGKVVFLGIDAGSRDLLLQWGKDRTLPSIHRLLSESLMGFTESVPGLFVGSTWATWFTGVNPGKHGRYSQQQLIPGTYDLTPYEGEPEVKRQPFWYYLSQAGRKVAILDIPHSTLSQSLNGLQLVEYGAHDAHSGFLTCPAELGKEIQEQFGPPCSHPVRGDCDAKRDPDGVADFRDILVQRISKKTALTKHLMHRDRWDFFSQVFTESHCVGHQCWHIHDTAHQWHDRDSALLVGDPIKDVYKAIDAAIGEILEEIDNQTTVILLASHGMGPTNIPYGFLEKLLLLLGVIIPPRMNSKNTTSFLVHKRLLPLLSHTWQMTPARLQQSFMSQKTRISQKLYSVPSLPKVDRENSQCFVIHDNPSHAGIRVNLVGREPRGKIKPGREFEQFCDDLQKDLLSIVNVGTGKPVIQRIIRTADHYSGEYLDHLPDLLVEWNEEDAIPAVASEKFGKVDTQFWHPRTGHHRIGGVFFAFGPGIQPGTVNRTVSIMDFAPTIANLLNVSLPDADGRPIEEIFSSALPSSTSSNCLSPSSHSN